MSQENQNLSSKPIQCVVLTIHDGTSSNHDSSGKLIESLLHEGGHEVVYRRVVKQSEAAVREAFAEALADDECEVILTTGGIGVSHKDEVWNILHNLYQKRIDSFGNLLNTLIFAESGPACLYSRPSAGIIEKHPVFSLPLNSTSIRVALEKLILPELNTLVLEARK